MSTMHKTQNMNQFFTIQNQNIINLKKSLGQSELHSTEYAVREFYSDDTEKHEDVLDRENELESTRKIKIVNRDESRLSSRSSNTITKKQMGSNVRSYELGNPLHYIDPPLRIPRQSHSASKCNNRSKLAGMPAIGTTTGTSVFRSKEGVHAQMTPISKRFAPVYASSHSLVANSIKHSAEKTLTEQK